MNLTLRNVSVFDRRLHRFYPAIIVERGGCFELIRANVHTPKVIAISLKESKLTLVRTTITDCCTAVCSGKSDLRLTECVIDSCSPIWPSFSFKDSNCVARNIRCSSSGLQCADFARSKVTMEDCQFRITSYSDESYGCLRIYKGSHVFIRKSTFSNFRMAVTCSDSDTKLIMDDCLVSLEAMSIAFDLMLNAHALVENCQLSCGVVANSCDHKSKRYYPVSQQSDDWRSSAHDSQRYCNASP